MYDRMPLQSNGFGYYSDLALPLSASADFYETQAECGGEFELEGSTHYQSFLWGLYDVPSLGLRQRLAIAILIEQDDDGWL